MKGTGWHYMVANRPKSRYGVHEAKHSAVGERRGDDAVEWWEMASRGNMICLESDLEAMMVDILVDIICAEDIK